MADFTLSPGIVIKENDQSVRTPAFNLTSIGGVVGRFDWGPAMIPTLITSEADMITEFGKPKNDNYVEWFNAYNFLQYGETINIIRVVDADTAKNATSSGSSVLITNDDEYMNSLIVEEGGLKDSSATGVKFGSDILYGSWIARYPGDLGNSITVDMCSAVAPSEAMNARTDLIPANTVNMVEFDHVADNKYTVKFSTHSMGSNTYITSFSGGTGYFQDTGQDVINQEKVVSFTYGTDTYNMLIHNDNGDGTVEAYVNVGATGTPSAAVRLVDTGDTLTALTVRERSKYKEHSHGAVRNSPNNLMGSVYYDNNSDKIYGVNTAFTKQVAAGDILTILGQKLPVAAVVSDTEIRIQQPIVGKALVSAPVSWSREWKYASIFTGPPATSNDAKAVNKNLTGVYNDQLHIVVIDAGGLITGNINGVIESFAFLSVAKDGRDDFGGATYYVNRVNNSSDWVKWAAHPLDVASVTNNWGSKTEGTVFNTYHKTISAGVTDYLASRFTNGTGGNPIADDDLTLSIQQFNSKEDVDVDFLISGWTYQAGGTPLDYRLAISQMIKVAEARQDCVVCVSGDYGQIVSGYSNPDDITDRFVSWREGVYNSSYAFMDGNFKYQYDSYNDTYRWLPLSGDIAGLMAQTDVNYYPWFSPAGYTRGQIRNVVKLAFNPSQENRDILYTNQINPVITIRGEGTLLFGDKTLQKIASAFDRINVRRLFITMKDFVVVQARRKLFEFNTPATRADFKRLCEQYLETVVLQQGASEFRVICDETNNTANVIEQNRFIADIYVRPNYVINFIQLNFTAVGQTVDFADLGI